jgi:uncharacterized protein YidB (DUF937 family)
MASFEDALKNAVPGGDLATPIAVAVGALLLGKLFSGSSAPAPAPAPAPVPTAPASTGGGMLGGGLLGGLGQLVQSLQNGGHGDVVNSWIGQGQNAPIQPGQLGPALGNQTISDLARQSGLSEQELLAQLAKVLPNVVNNLTPNGRLPTLGELQQG